jgi:hypothetical protein
MCPRFIGLCHVNLQQAVVLRKPKSGALPAVRYNRAVAKDGQPATPWTSFDEENLLHDINEDNRLRRLGIEPDEMDSLAILIALRKKAADIKQEKLERQKQRESPPPRSESA